METLYNLAQKINSENFHQKSAKITIGSHEDINMDVLQMVEDPTQANGKGVIGVFHLSPGVGPVPGTEPHSWLYLATSSLDNLDVWIPLNNGNPYSTAGSMGYIFKDPNSSVVYLAYELESVSGNQIAVRYYNSMLLLKQNDHEKEWILSKDIDGTTAQNVGTPVIESVDTSAIYITFHYQLNSDDEDRPGRGILLLDGSLAQTGWYTSKQEQITKSFAEAGVAGKIGGRDYVEINDRLIYFYEAQLSQDTSNLDSQERWRSWRTFLYAPGFEMNQVMLLNLVIQGSSTFANPRSSIIKDKLIMTFFVPSERVGNLSAGTVLFEVDISEFN